MKDNSRNLEDWIDGFMEFTENTVESPYLYRLWTAISCIASVLQRKVSMDWGHSPIYPNMYIVLIGPSGKARKGTAMRPGLSLLYDIGLNVAADSVTRERLIRDLRESNFASVDSEGKHIMHSSLTIVNEELTVFLG